MALVNGIGKGLKSLWKAVTNSVQTAKGLIQSRTMAGQDQVAQAISKKVNDFSSANAVGKIEMASEVLGEVVVGLALEEGAGAFIKMAKAVPDSGMDVYRVYGGDSKADGFSYSTTDSSSVSNFRDRAGLPSGGTSGSNNTGQFVLEGTVNSSKIIKQRPALPLDGNKGGLPELIIDPKNVNVKRVSGANPEF